MSTILKGNITGAVTLPADLCRSAGIEPGAELTAEVHNQQIVLVPARPTLAQRIIARAIALPPEFVEKLPADGAAQHDHYIYGTPKRPLG